MTRFFSRFATAFLLLAGAAAAQDMGLMVRIGTVPGGLQFFVDGMSYQQTVTLIWPVGSKHTLAVPIALVNNEAQNKTKYSFGGWQWSGGMLSGGDAVTVTAAPGMTDIKAMYTVSYALSLNFFNCDQQAPCSSSGTVYVGGTPYTSNQDLYMGAGAVVQLLAVPNPGFVFSGWLPGASQVIQGASDTVTMTGPVTVYPQFAIARRINLASVPDGLILYADRARVPGPTSLDWGWNSVHMVGAVSPQQDLQGNWWVFSSWSDGGDMIHNYTVAPASSPDTLTATFVPASVTAFHTNPPGLQLKIDGRQNWPAYTFIWLPGETHQIEAPAQQTDAAGRVWAFSSWSNGGDRVQTFTVPASGAGPAVLTAIYTQMGHLTINSPVGGLSVKVDGADCGTPCDVVRPLGTAVKLSAPASLPNGDNSRSDFDGWPGSGSSAPDWSLTLGSNPVTLSVTYHAMNRLVTTSNPPNGASWQLQPFSPDGFYTAQTTVTVNVTAQPGFRFRNWTGDLSGTTPAGTVAMSAPRMVQAVLDRVPFIAPTGVANAAGSTPASGVAPGSIISIFGASLATAQVTGPVNPMLQALDCATVRVGDRLLPLFFVSPGQINAQLPDDIQPGQQNLTVSCQGLPDVQAPFTVVRNAPGLFQQASGGQNFAIALHEDGSLVTTDAPAKIGELLSLLGTGFGPADHARPEGFPVPDSPQFLITDTATVQVGSETIPAVSAFADPGQIGIDVIQVRLDDASMSGTNVQVHVTVNGQDSNTVVLPVASAGSADSLHK